jgi:integrase/recombinase XerD
MIDEKKLSHEELVEKFLNNLDAKPDSKYIRKKQLRAFFKWVKERLPFGSIDTLTTQDIFTYKDYLLAYGKSAHTVGNYLSGVKQFFSFIEEEGLGVNIAKKLKNFQRPKGHMKDCLTIEQIREALSSFDVSIEEGARDYAIFNLLVRTGLRTIEVARASVEDIRQKGGDAILWIQGKGRDSKDDFVLLIEDSLRPIRRYLAMRKITTGKEPLFSSLCHRTQGRPLTAHSISEIIKNTLKRIDINDSRITAHSLRHTAVTLSIKNGASIVQAQAMARHADPKTTMIYFHNEDRLKCGAERYVII